MQAESQAAWICTAMMRLGTRMATGFDRLQLDNLQATLERLEAPLREFNPSSPNKELP
jgi:hypothetical protein